MFQVFASLSSTLASFGAAPKRAALVKAPVGVAGAECKLAEARGHFGTLLDETERESRLAHRHKWSASDTLAIQGLPATDTFCRRQSVAVHAIGP